MTTDIEQFKITNIIDEIHSDIEKFEQINGVIKDCKCDKYSCRFNLFQFLQLKHLNNIDRDYVGYIMSYVWQYIYMTKLTI